MALLTGMTEDGQEVPVQVKPDGRLVAEGLIGPVGPVGPQGSTGPTGPAGPQGAAGLGYKRISSFLSTGPSTCSPGQRILSGIDFMYQPLSSSGQLLILGSFQGRGYGRTEFLVGKKDLVVNGVAVARQTVELRSAPNQAGDLQVAYNWNPMVLYSFASSDALSVQVWLETGALTYIAFGSDSYNETPPGTILIIEI